MAGEPDPEIIKVTARLAAAALRGEIRAIAFVTIDPAGRGHYHMNDGDLPYAILAGHVTRLQHDVVDGWGESIPTELEGGDGG